MQHMFTKRKNMNIDYIFILIFEKALLIDNFELLFVIQWM